MSDVFTKAKRSAVMSRIRGAGNKDTELRLIVLMRAAGITGWRRGARLRFAAGRRMTEGGGQQTEVRNRTTEDGRPKGERRWISARHSPALSRPNGSHATRHSPHHHITIRPDFVFPKQRLAVFVDGCFFHGCPKHATWPKNNAAFWRAKIEGNIARDRLQNRLLRKNQWRVIRIWEHALSTKNARRTIARIKNTLLATRSRVLTGKTLTRAHRGPVRPR